MTPRLQHSITPLFLAFLCVPCGQIIAAETKSAPEQPLRRYLYLAMRDSSILPPLAMGSRDPHGIIVLDLDHGLRFVKRIGSEVLHQGRATVSSGPGVRWMHGSAVTDRLYYGYSEPGAKYLRGIRSSTPPPAGANALIGCLDLRTDETVWEQPTRNACSLAVFPDGSKLLAVPDQSQAAHGKMTLLDAATGRILEEIPSQSRVAYGVNVMPDGRHLLPNVWGGTLTAFDTQSGREVTFASLFPSLDTLDWSAVPERFRQFDSLDVATHYSVNGAGDFLWSQIREVSRRTRVADPLHGSLVCLDLRRGRAGIAPLEPALLHQSVDPDRSRYHPWNAWDDTSIHLFGIGYVAALSPDERWLYHGTYAGDFAALAWDRAAWPPRLAGVIGAGLASETETDPISGEPVGVRCKSGAWLSADGRILFTSDSWCFDTRTWKPVGLMRNDRGEIIRCAKMNEVHFRGKDCVYFGQRFGYGRHREPKKLFPPSTDKTPPTAADQLAATVSKPAARWSGGEVVVSVELHWQPASDDDGVQRYAVYRDGELIGNCLGHNPGDPVLSEADAAVYRAQLGDENPNTFTARYLKPGQTYRFEIEPVDFAQNHGPRTRLAVAVPHVTADDEDALVQAWAAHIVKRSQEAPDAEARRHCREALTTWLSKTHAHRPWAATFLDRLKPTETKP